MVEVDWTSNPKSSWKQRPPWPPESSLKKLNEQQMDCYRKELKVYSESGLWVLVEDDKPETGQMKRVMSPYFRSFKKIKRLRKSVPSRPVLDCRWLNKTFPVATSLSGATRKKVSELKMIPSGFTHILLVDLRRAFYSLRLCNKKLGIYLGHGKTAMTDRMAFGLSVGQAALRAAESLMFDEHNRSSP